MAAVSQHAMRRHPGGPLDPSASIGSGYYGTSCHQDPHIDKAKKSWSQRLKLVKSDKSSSNSNGIVHIPESPMLQSPSALSRSMKYAEPWLYGTVRGMPTPNAVNYDYLQPQYRLMPELAVVLCSCREYLTGTKRELKKATVCKKCKGSRLPITPVGGTMRIHSTQCIVQANHRNSVGTVRLPSSTFSTSSSSGKQRPSILANDNDPYDVMRRSRLMSPDLKSVKSTKSRAKSSSPPRNKDRYAKQNASPATNGGHGTIRLVKHDSRSRSATRIIDVESNWTTESMDSDSMNDAMATRRSILQCNVNPYELISKSAHNNEFAPLDGDDVYDMHSQKYENLLNSLHDHKVLSANGTSNSMRRDKTTAAAMSQTSTNGDDAYEKYNFSTISTPTVNHSTYGKSPREAKVNALAYAMNNGGKSESSALPCNKSSTSNNKVNEIESVSTSPRVECRTVSMQDPSPIVLQAAAQTATDNCSATIKSILKRPPATATSATNVSNANDTRNVRSIGATVPAAKHLVVRRSPPKKVSTSSTITVPIVHSISPLPSGQNTKNNIHAMATANIQANKGNGRAIASATAAVTAAVAIADGTLRAKQNSGSHFYLPLPQRKKVQFSVEHEVIDENGSIENGDINVSNDAEADVRLTDAAVNVIGESGDHDDDVRVDKIITETAATMTTAATVVSKPKAIYEKVEVNGDDMTVQKGTIVNGHSNHVRDTKKADKGAVMNGAEAKTDKKKIQRSLSDRRVPDPSANINFQDTTALRPKQLRTDSRDLFNESTESTASPRSRPTVPPPPPPSVRANLKTPIRPPRQNARRTTLATSTPRISTSANRLNLERPKTEPKPKSPAAAEPVPASEIYQDIYVQRKRIQANNEAFQGSRIFNAPSNTPIKKTVVKVAPLIIHKESDAIHRLEVRNEQDDYESFKKTSVLISGDDCYSTINVNDDTPIYQASVVVNDITTSMPSSVEMNSNTITINVTTTTATPEDVIHNNKKNMLLSAKTTIASKTIENESITSNSSQTKTTIFLDYKDTNNDSYVAEKSSSDVDKINTFLRDPVEAVKMNLVPHVCGKYVAAASTNHDDKHVDSGTSTDAKKLCANNSFISKLLEDPTLGHLAEGLDSELVARLIENSLLRLKESRNTLKISGTKDEQDMNKLIENSLQKVKEERQKLDSIKTDQMKVDEDKHSNRDSMSSGNSFSSANYELFDFDHNDLSDCYQSCSSELTTDDDGNITRSKFYQMLVDATLSEIEISTSMDDDHHYESIRLNGGDPIYEEISDIPPPLPLCPPPSDIDVDKKNAKSMFEGASKYDILSYLVDAKERGIVPEDSYTFNFPNVPEISVANANLKDGQRENNEPDAGLICRTSQLSATSDTGDESSLTPCAQRKTGSDIERNDSGVGSETSKSSRSKYQSLPGSILNKNSPIHLCEDCDGPVETQVTDSGVMFAPLVCRKCGKKRAERKEIVTEMVETEEKYGRDLQIILEEFYQPMLVAGLLTQEQLSAIFLNTEELLENSQSLSEKMRDALDIANEQGDDDLLTVDIGKLILEAAPMLHAFESYCVRQAAASLLLANLEKEKELLRIFLRVSQMENTVLRRMNLNSFLMVPVQRVTKYPLLLARLFKVTPTHLKGRDMLKQAQEKIELHLNHMNREAKDIPTKLWRRISSSSPGRRSTCEIDMINIKLRKMAIDLLEWNHDEVRFAIEGKLLFTQPTDNNWRKGRTIKLTPVNALLVTNGKPSASAKLEKFLSGQVNFPKHTGIREATLLLVREKSGRYTVLREPLFLDRCIVSTEAEWEDYFEVHEISSKETFIFKAEDGERTKQWYSQLQFHAQGMGAWRKRRNALANIMINGMMRS